MSNREPFEPSQHRHDVATPPLTQAQIAEIIAAHTASPPQLPQLTPEQIAAVLAMYSPTSQQHAQRQYEQAIGAIDAKVNMKQHEAALTDARQRAARPDPVLAIATSSDQISVHVDMWKVVQYTGTALILAAAGYGLFLLVREGTRWVAKRYMA